MSKTLEYRGYRIIRKGNSVYVYDPFGLWTFTAESIADAKTYIDCLIEEGDDYDC